MTLHHNSSYQYQESIGGSTPWALVLFLKVLQK